MLWLGLAVLWNAARRAWAVWLAGSGLSMAAVFLSIHSAIYAHGWAYASWGLDLIWYVGWLLVIALPLTWYVLTLWYAGYWDDRTSSLYHRQRPWLACTVLAAAGLAGLLILANPFPSYSQIVDYESAARPILGGFPLAGLVYPLYIVLSIALSVDVLRRPAPSAQMMGDVARRRARPWLVATSLALLAVSALVGWIIVWVMLDAGPVARAAAQPRLAFTIAWFDLAIDALIALAILCLGQAVVSYEIFTGKVLPRRGLRSHWQSTILLAAAFGLVAGGSLSRASSSTYGLLACGVLMAASHALFSRQSYAERDRYIEQLRPFVASQRLYEHLRADQPVGAADAHAAAEPFEAMCADLLGARVAYLAALGPLAPLAGPPLCYPAGQPAPTAALPSLVGQISSPATLCMPVDPAAYGEATWAVPLWSGSELIGVLLLGEKRDGGLYAQEEIEIARAGGERLLDTQASAELARRLMALQRRRLTESRVLDGQARRALHDDVLPRLHAAILKLSSAEVPPAAVELLTEVHRRVSDLLHDMPPPAAPTLERLGLLETIRGLVVGELAGSFDTVEWRVEPEAEARASSLPLPAAEVLFYAAREALRNAARHGRGHENRRPLRLTIVAHERNGLELRIEDNGVGMRSAAPAEGGSGQGLALHSTMMAVIGGSLSVESLEGAYTCVSLFLPAAAWLPMAH